MKNIWLKTGLLGMLLICISAGQVPKSYIYILTQQENKGDCNAALGIANCIQSLNPSTEIIEFENKQKKPFLKAIKKNLIKKPWNKGIIIAVGDYSIETLKDLKPQANVVIVHSSHQWTEKHKDLNNIATFVALPKHTLTPEIEKTMHATQIIPTIGVAHNLTPELIQKEYDAHKQELPKSNKYIGMILGGDAPTPEGKMLYYTQKEAQQLAAYLAGQVKWRKVHLLILNGPRTGKYNPQTHEVIKESHRNGSIDPVTTAFVTELKKRKLVQGKDFTLIDFQYDQPSLQKAVFGALLRTKSPIYVAGESTTSISETVSTLPGLVTVFKNNAMNPNHDAHVQSEQEAGHVHVLTLQTGKWILSKAASQATPQNNQSAAQTIAVIVNNQFQQLPTEKP